MANADVVMMNQAVELFYRNNQRYPTTSEGLQILLETKRDTKSKKQQGIILSLPKDPWGNSYQYRFPGIHNPDSFDVWTYGADGVLGGEGINGSCGNWQGGKCYPKPTNYLVEFYQALIILISQIVWLPLYLIISGVKLYRGKGVKSAMTGWHLTLMLLSFPAFVIAIGLLASLTPLC